MKTYDRGDFLTLREKDVYTVFLEVKTFARSEEEAMMSVARILSETAMCGSCVNENYKGSITAVRDIEEGKYK
jgi:hypothetical protein